MTTKPTCEKQVRDVHDIHMEGWHSLVPCGKPAKYSMSVGTGTIYLCGVHARRYIRMQQPWRKIMALKKPMEAK